MRPRIPRQAAVDHGPNHAEIESRLTDELVSVVGGARRRALRDGDRQIDTAHLLHSLLESDPQVRAAFDPPQIARLLGYLVQRSIGYGLRWQIGVEDSGAGSVVAGVPGWSPVAARAMAEAYESAVRRGERRAHGIDLLAAVVSAPASRAVEVLGHARVDAGVLAWRVQRVSGDHPGHPDHSGHPDHPDHLGHPDHLDHLGHPGHSSEGRPWGVQSSEVRASGVRSDGLQSGGVQPGGPQSGGLRSSGLQPGGLRGVRSAGEDSSGVQAVRQE